MARPPVHYAVGAGGGTVYILSCIASINFNDLVEKTQQFQATSVWQLPNSVLQLPNSI